MTNPKQEWEEEFERFWNGTSAPTRWQEKEEIKSFIQSLLLSNNKRLAEKVRGMDNKSERCKRHTEPCEGCAYVDGFNQAIEQVLSIIEKE